MLVRRISFQRKSKGYNCLMMVTVHSKFYISNQQQHKVLMMSFSRYISLLINEFSTLCTSFINWWKYILLSFNIFSSYNSSKDPITLKIKCKLFTMAYKTPILLFDLTPCHSHSATCSSNIQGCQHALPHNPMFWHL